MQRENFGKTRVHVKGKGKDVYLEANNGRVKNYCLLND